jgi:hypothetical protein
VWIANSVGLLNYKAFLLFLLYTLLACALAAAMLLRDVVTFFRGLDQAGPPEQAGRCAPGDIPGSLLASPAHASLRWALHARMHVCVQLPASCLAQLLMTACFSRDLRRKT